MQLIPIVVISVLYVALGALSSIVAYSQDDSWSVWLASGLTLGLLLARPRTAWTAVLIGAFIGTVAFALIIGSSPLEAIGYGCIELIAAVSGAWLASRISMLPLRLEAARDLAAIVVGGALPLALVGAALATLWHVAAGGGNALPTFITWTLANVVGALLVAPLALTWSQFRPRRSGGLPMPTFVFGAIATLLFLVSLWLIFDGQPDQRFGGSVGAGITYVPFVFMALVALQWGSRGATLVAFVGALLVVWKTAQGQGPFAIVEAFSGEALLEVQAYAAAVAITGLLISVLGEGQRRAMLEARAWQTRFESAISAHRMLAYEWDPASGRLLVTGDTTEFLGMPAAKLGVLADWLRLPVAEDREAVAARFEQRATGDGSVDRLAYRVSALNGEILNFSDEARAIRDHDGSLHRVVGIVRVGAGSVTDRA